MPTTSNFGWTTPADTDLVKDGAAAIRTLGNGIDTSLVDLKGGTTGQILSKASNTDLDYTWIANDQGDITEVAAGTGITVTSGTGPIATVALTTPVGATNGGTAQTTYATGDLLYASGTNTLAKRAIGSTGNVLTVSGGVPTWVAPSSGGMTLLSTTSLTGSSVTVSTIDQTYVDLVGVIIDVYQAADTARTSIRLNGDTGSNYAFGGVRITGNTVAADESGADTSMIISHRSTTANTDLQKTAAYFTLPRYTSSDNKSFFNSCWTSTGANGCFMTSAGVYDSTTAISSITILTSSTFSGGTFYLYGVK